MDETIGVKGGHNDYKRVMTITKKQKEKLKKYQEKKELKDLEKEVKKKQIYTLIKTLPIVLVGQTFKELTTPKTKKEEKFIVEDKEVFLEEKPKTRKVVIELKDGTKQVIEVPIDKEIISKQGVELKEIISKTKFEVEEPTKVEKQEFIPLKEEKEKQEVNKEFNDLTENQKDKLQKLQARKIIDVYERQLKDIRYELRNLIFEYNTLVAEEENIIQSKEAERIIDKLNEIISKIEVLKEKIRIDNLDKYDDNYIYTLVEGYLEEFKDQKVIKEIKDSPLYILISEKLDEFDKKKEKFKEQVESEKEEFEEKEKNLEDLKEKYLKIDKLNKDLDDFYRKQELLLKEMQDKIDKAVTVTEKVEVQVETMNLQARMLLSRIALLMLLPGKRSAKALAATVGIYASLARNMLQPKTTTKTYKEITVYDYTRDIERNITKIEDVVIDLSKSSKELDNIISEIKNEFSDYIGVIPECDELLSNLKKVKDNFKEKEYELEKIKSKQEQELERNNSKLLTRGTYPM